MYFKITNESEKHNALWCASSKGYFDIVKLLIEKWCKYSRT